MVGLVIFLAICIVGIAFLVHVFIAFCQDSSPRYPARKFRRQISPLVIQLRAGPILNPAAIRAVGESQDAPLTIVAHSNKVLSQFYVDKLKDEPVDHRKWHLFVNPRNAHARRAL